MGAVKKAGAGGGTVMMARGNSGNPWLDFLALSDVTKELVYIIVDEGERDAVRQAILDLGMDKKKNFGVLFALNIGRFIKTGVVSISGSEGETMRSETPYELITVILNKGFVDDAMAAARKAGATGGTIIYAHGTGKEEDAKFFGVTIVPEKELLMVVAPRDKAPAIVEAVRTLPCLAKPGSGVAFCMGVEEFLLLGRQSTTQQANPRPE
jgi:nitrogen regulatory protein PII